MQPIHKLQTITEFADAVNCENAMWCRTAMNAGAKNPMFMTATLVKIMEILSVASGPENEEKLRELRYGVKHLDSQCMAQGHTQLSEEINRRGQQVLKALMEKGWPEEVAAQKVPRIVAGQLLLLKEGYKVTNVAQKLFQALGGNVEIFANPGTAVTIANQWVDATTEHVIPKILDRVPEDTAFIALAAAKVSADYTESFLETFDRPLKFANADGSSVFALGMVTYRECLCVDVGSYEALELPCMGDLSLLLIRPKEASAAMTVLKSCMEGGVLNHLIKEIQTKRPEKDNFKKVELCVPEVDLEADANYLELFQDQPAISLLTKVNFNGPFIESSDTDPVKLKLLLSKHVFKMTHTGFLMAGAVAAVGVKESMMFKPKGYHPFIVDRPYAVAILDQPSGCIIGTIQINNLVMNKKFANLDLVNLPSLDELEVKLGKIYDQVVWEYETKEKIEWTKNLAEFALQKDTTGIVAPVLNHICDKNYAAFYSILFYLWNQRKDGFLDYCQDIAKDM